MSENNFEVVYGAQYGKKLSYEETETKEKLDKESPLN